MHWLLSQKAACEFSRHNLQQSGPSSYVYLLFTLLLFLLLFLLVLFPSSLLLFFFPFLRLLFLLLFTKTFAGETLFSGKTDSHSRATWVAIWQMGPSNAWNSFWSDQDRFQDIVMLFFSSKRKQKKDQHGYLKNHSIWLIYFL